MQTQLTLMTSLGSRLASKHEINIWGVTNAQRATAQRNADAQTGQTGRVYRSDRLSSGRPAARPTNVAREGPVGVGERR